MDDYNKKLSEELIESVRTIESDEDKNNVVEAISTKLGVDKQQASMIVEMLTVVIRNDYLLLDMFLGVINGVLTTLRLRKCISDEDIEDIKKEIEKYNDQE